MPTARLQYRLTIQAGLILMRGQKEVKYTSMATKIILTAKVLKARSAVGLFLGDYLGSLTHQALTTR